jgi:hypothetical protein
MNLSTLTVEQLKQALVIKEKIEALEKELGNILGASVTGPTLSKGRRKVSAAARAKMAAAQRARRARESGQATGSGKNGVRGRRKMSAAAKARLSAIARQRWKKARAAGRAKL